MKREISFEMRHFLAAKALLLAMKGETTESENIRQFLMEHGTGRKAESASGTGLDRKAVAA